MGETLNNIQNFRFTGACLIAALTLAPGWAAAQPKPAAAAVAAPIDAQWEYLVVSYGKTLFGSPEKTLAYRSIGLVATAQEATEIQRSLDVLGRFGWEVITIVGTIGGDQQIVFKRRYDKTRSANEATAILKGKDLYLKDLVDILERERRVREEAQAASEVDRNKPRLIELDAQAADQERRRVTAERQEKVAAALATVPWGQKSTFTIYASGDYTSMTVKADVTDELLINGNSYRKSDTSRWLNGTAGAFLKQAASSFPGSIYITVEASITFNGKSEKVGEQKFSYSSVLRRWD